MKFDERTGAVEGVEGVSVSRYTYTEPTELEVDLPDGKRLVVRADSTLFGQYEMPTPTLGVTIKEPMPVKMRPIGNLDREKTQLQETGRCSIVGLTSEELMLIINDLGIDPGCVLLYNNQMIVTKETCR